MEKKTEKIIGGSLVVIGLVSIALLIAILVKVIQNEKNDSFPGRDEGGFSEQFDGQTPPELPEGMDRDDGITDTSNYIASDKALEVALKNVGLTKADVSDVEVELERKSGQVVYEVSFDAGQYEYEYYIDAESGEIVKSFREIDF